jgi:hypothetical protein
MAGHLNGHAGGRAEAVKRNSSACFDAGNAQAAKSDDSGAEQRRRLLVGEAFGNRIDEILGRDYVFSVTTVNRVTREGGMVAKIFHSGAAEFTGLVRAMQPGNSNARSQRKTVRTLA